MRFVGLDLGTTSVAVAVVDVGVDTGAPGVLDAWSKPHGAEVPAPPGEHLQDPELFYALAEALIAEAEARFGKPSGIGVTGQMHGVVYLDERGEALGPLQTWRDERAEALGPTGKRHREQLREVVGSEVPAGYGAATHFANLQTGRVPAGSSHLATLPDYVAMRLAGSRIATSPSLAESIGLYDVKRGAFEVEAWAKLMRVAAVSPPRVVATGMLGQYGEVPVAVAIGDNQAGFVGSVLEPERTLFVNVGTSAQLCFALPHGDAPDDLHGLELRVLPGGGTLVVGASLAGGAALRVLAELVMDLERRLTGQVTHDPYALLDVDPAEAPPPRLVVDTRLAGTRRDPGRRGGIGNLTAHNFTWPHLAYGFAEGVARELHEFWAEAQASLPTPVPEVLVGVGNAVRKGRLMQRVLREVFGLPLALPRHREEAAVGAALWAAAQRTKAPLSALARRVVRLEPCD